MEPLKSEDKPIRDSKTGLFVKGNPGGPGRPAGVSFTERIKEIFLNDPKKFEETCKYYMDDPRMKELLWKMIDGMPRQQTDLTTNGEKLEPLIIIKDGNKTV